MPATAAAWAAAYPDRIDGESLVATLKDLHGRKEVDLDTEGNVVLTTPPVFNADIAMDAAMAVKAANLSKGAVAEVLSANEAAFLKEMEEGVYADALTA